MTRSHGRPNNSPPLTKGMKTKKENQLRAWPICPTARRFMRKLLTITFTISGCLAFCPRPALALVFSAPGPKSVYTDASGKKQSAQVVDKYYPRRSFSRLRRATQTSTLNSVGRPPLPRNAPCPLAFQVLAFREGRAGCCRRGEVPAADNAGETSRPRAREQLRVQKTPRLESL